MSCTAAVAALSAMLGMSGCDSPPQPSGSVAGFAADLGQPGARVDGAQARAVISAYRLNLGLSEKWEWLAGIPITLLLASLSHFFVEQKALALRHRFDGSAGAAVTPPLTRA